MKAIPQFLQRIRKAGRKRPGCVKTVAMGKERLFDAWDVGEDTFIFEHGIRHRLKEHPSVLMVSKKDLHRRASGYVFTMTTGNHSVAAFPLLDGRFWKLARVPAAQRGDVLMHKILCANVVNDTIEISQREIPSKNLYRVDDWLLSTVGFRMPDIVMGERNVVTLEHYRELGQEWRVKPLAWTENEMKVALAASKKRISSSIRYYHSMKGVHFLSFTEFKKFTQLAHTNYEAFEKGMRELVSVYEGNAYSFTRMPKLRGHHEIELFGLRRGVAIEKLIPALDRLMEAMTLGRIGQLGVIQKLDEILSLYESLLTQPAFADDTSKEFTEALYMYITGEIYSVTGEGSTPAFDDRRTALPGATFVDGRPVFHPGADDRSEVLLSNIRGLLSKDEKVEYANVYELRDADEKAPIGYGRTREIVYKTNRHPLEKSLVVKRLAQAKKGYASYVLARIEALKALGVALGDYRILRRRAQKNQCAVVDYFVRNRIEGEPMQAIPKNYFSNVDDSSVEEREAVLALAVLMGDAAAQNMAMKKFDAKTQSPLYGEGKEIYEFEYDILIGRIIPKKVTTCSVRGSFGWENLDETDENLRQIAAFYLTYFAHTLKIFQREHPSIRMKDLAESFMEGFEFRTHAMEWQLSVLRDKFEGFKPDLLPRYGFDKKWRFVLWSLERQERRLPMLKKQFFQKVEIEEHESLWNHSEPVRLESLPR